MKDKNHRIIFLLLAAVFMTALMLTASTSTSPLYPNHYSYDSAFFRFIGKEIIRRKVPYKDIWDNKGPVLFFIQAIGAWKGTINKGTNILFIMQIAAAVFSVFWIREIDCLLNRRRHSIPRFLLILLTTSLIFFQTCIGGNLTEEWSLPMICLSMFLMIKYAVTAAQSEAGHPKGSAYLHGLCLGLIAFIRLNNAIPICGGLAVIGIRLICKKQWKNLFVNILFGIFGILTAALPIMLWFYQRNALNEMIYSVFLYNLQYAKSRTFVSYRGEPFFLRYLPLGAAFLMIICHWLRTREWHLSDWITIGISLPTAVMLIRSNVYLHYYLIFVPILALILILYMDRIRLPEILIPAILLISFSIFTIRDIPDLISMHYEEQQFSAAEKIPQNEQKSMMAVNIPPEIYLNYGLEPVNRFCAYQYAHFPIDPEMKQEFLTALEENTPLWLISFCQPEDGPILPEVQELESEAYHLEFSQNGVCYYRLNE